MQIIHYLVVLYAHINLLNMRYLIAVTIFSLTTTFGIAQTDLSQDTITKENAHLITSYDENDIESMVTYYFASRIRGDEKWKEVLPDPQLWTDRMLYSIDKHNRLNFTKFKNIGFYESLGGWYVKVFVWVEMDGRADGGQDDVTLKKEGDKWIIWKVPT